MECEEFLDGYSAYRDGLLEPGREARFRRHLEGCSSCARYDRVVEKGTEVLRDLPRPEPSPDFLARLRHRLYHVRDGIPMSAGGGGGVAAVAVAAVGLLAFAWLPFAMQVPVEVELPAVAVEGPDRPVTEADAAPRGPAGSVELPRFFEPGLLGGGPAATEVGTDPWSDAALWSGGSGDAPTALGARTRDVSFLATTRGPAAPGR